MVFQTSLLILGCITKLGVFQTQGSSRKGGIREETDMYLSVFIFRHSVLGVFLVDYSLV